MSLESPIRDLKGIGEKTEKLFHRAGVRTIRDLLLFFPRTYDLYAPPKEAKEAAVGRVCTISGLITAKPQVGGSRQLPVTTVTVRDGETLVRAVWFRMPYIRSLLSGGGRIILRGRLRRYKGHLMMEQPEIFYPPSVYDKKLDSLQPVYSLVSGLSNNAVTKAVRMALPMATAEMDLIPGDVADRQHIPSLALSLQAMHFPRTKEEYVLGRRRFAFQEFFLFILALYRLKEQTDTAKNLHPIPPSPRTDALVDTLPFTLTDAQRNVWQTIRRDMSGPRPMARLVQGDVGCGKTILAFLAMLDCAFGGEQAALMAPTEVLARQHYNKLTELLADIPDAPGVVLLTGSMTAAQKREARERLALGTARLAVGTHALFQDGVRFADLALVVTDEQHRFGVAQREKLVKKGENTHVLVMSATPIPRSMAIILYGDLDLSVITELPKNRLPIRNCVADESYRSAAFAFMEEEMEKGHQCYVICPMIEESESSEAQNVQAYADRLRETYDDRRRIGILHGKMTQQEKDAVMSAFYEHELDILVATTVIEVGIDVPNATVMVIEDAQSFGLAQLHQLRGRVGRGAASSYCIFISSSKSEEAMKRLAILKHSNDGFYIAREDLKQRGPGDLFGIRQSGDFNFRIGDIYQDAPLVAEAALEARNLLAADPNLTAPEHRKLAGVIEKQAGRQAIGQTL